MLKKVLAGLAALAAFAALFFRGQSIKYKAKAKHQSERADSAEETAALHRRINNNVTHVEQKHRQEQVNEKDSFDAGNRNQLDNNW